MRLTAGIIALLATASTSAIAQAQTEPSPISIPPTSAPPYQQDSETLSVPSAGQRQSPVYDSAPQSAPYPGTATSPQSSTDPLASSPDALTSPHLPPDAVAPFPTTPDHLQPVLEGFDGMAATLLPPPDLSATSGELELLAAIQRRIALLTLSSEQLTKEIEVNKKLIEVRASQADVEEVKSGVNVAGLTAEKDRELELMRAELERMRGELVSARADAQSASAAQQANTEAAKALEPTYARIVGVAGVLTADIRYPGGTVQRVVAGDTLNGDLRVVSVTRDGVRVRDKKGKEFALSKRQSGATASSSGAATVAPALDQENALRTLGTPMFSGAVEQALRRANGW